MKKKNYFEFIQTVNNFILIQFKFLFVQPILTKRITRINIEWRIRNLPYPLEIYNVTIDSMKKSIIVRTTNKKYFKEIPIIELIRCNTEPNQNDLKIVHQHNTLIVTVSAKYDFK